MLLKLAHVSVNFNHPSSSDFGVVPPGWTLSSRISDIHNPENKMCFLPHYESTHTLSLFRREGYVDIELVSQKSPSPAILFTAISRTANSLSLHVPHQISSESVLFFKTLGFHKSDTERTLISRHALDEFDITVTDAHPPKDAVKLDIYAAAFLSSCAKRDATRLSQYRFSVTPIETIDLGKSKIRCFFHIGPAGEIAEIYEYVKE